jgi:hypothetical protein
MSIADFADQISNLKKDSIRVRVRARVSALQVVENEVREVPEVRKIVPIMKWGATGRNECNRCNGKEDTCKLIRRAMQLILP